MRPSAIKALYKIILRDARKLVAVPGFRLRETPATEQWGQWVLLPRGHDQRKPSSFALPDERVRWLRLQKFLSPHGDNVDLVELVRTKFREGAKITFAPALSGRLDEMMWAIEEISHQRLLAESSSVTRTDDVVVEATGQYIPHPFDPSSHRFRYTYRIRVLNDGSVPIKITGRHYIFDHGGKKREILPRHTPQVVGQTPTILPGEIFEYASGVDLESVTGSVRGCLHAIRFDADGQEVPFDAIVAPFSLQPTVMEAMMLQ
ncbi:hypothetical protein LEN26_010287 [Aphanomyces euteiches]|nr:hypothetical protein LEN26_010287 [Aphanomyces euteiches]